MSERLIVSCFKGRCPISVPKEWVDEMDIASSFAFVDGEARIRFPNGRAFGLKIRCNGPEIYRIVRELDVEEATQTPWGPFCAPWESYRTAQLFGHGPVTELS